MSLIAVILIVISAVMHAGWNLISKRRSPSLSFFFITTVAAVLVVLPVLVHFRASLLHVSSRVWLLVLATGVAQTVYYLGLAGAYRRGAISLAYPLARALPVLMVVAMSFMLGKGEQITPVGLVGMLFISAGCVILPMTSFRQAKLRDYLDWVVLMAVIAAIGTTGCTLIDDQALSQLRLSPGIALSKTEVTLLYIGLQTLSTAMMLGLAVSLYPPERRELRALLGQRSMLLSGAITGLIIMTTYGLVLAAMA